MGPLKQATWQLNNNMATIFADAFLLTQFVIQPDVAAANFSQYVRTFYTRTDKNTKDC